MTKPNKKLRIVTSLDTEVATIEEKLCSLLNSNGPFLPARPELLAPLLDASEKEIEGLAEQLVDSEKIGTIYIGTQPHYVLSEKNGSQTGIQRKDESSSDFAMLVALDAESERLLLFRTLSLLAGLLFLLLGRQALLFWLSI